jgi:UPF0755 protein
MIKKYLILALILLSLIFAFCLAYWYNINNDAALNSQIDLEIEKGESIKNIAHKLKESRLINSEAIFKLYLYLNEMTNIKAGKYRFSGNYSLVKIAALLVAGENRSNTVRVKIIEGWNLAEINGYLTKNNLPFKDDFLTSAKHSVSDWNFDFPKPTYLDDAPSGADLEGYLFPDTYEVYASSSSRDLVFKMLENLNKKLDSNIRAEIIKQGRTIYEILTMASIIEKEVKKPDMNIVSGIFWKRIKNGQRLESCATLSYILGVNKAQYSYEDTLIDSPYNTYRHGGLPPGPISNPGMDAILAAVYPKETGYVFFLSRPDTGETVWSSTLDEHNLNKAKYLK